MIALCCLAVVALAGKAPAGEAQLSHAVFFELAEANEANASKLVAACKEYLSGHDGTVYFSVGTRVKEFDRDVNDTGFDVALLVVFENKAAHDAYQVAPRHLEFIERNASLWKGVRVFDSFDSAD
jgi:hypothetical protein